MNRHRLVIRGLMVLAFVLVISAACATSEPEKEKVLTIGLGGETTTLNMNIGQGGGGAWGKTIFEAMYNTLVSVDQTTGELLPELATEWKVLDDKLTWQFKLRQGVKFHNGEEFTAESVKVTLEDLINSDHAVSDVKRRTSLVDRVDVVDKYTVNIHTESPFVLLPVSVGEAVMYPPKYYQEVGQDAFSEKPVGTGQFKFEEWTKGTSITLVADPNYWGPKAKIDKLVFKPFPEPAARIAALERGEIDIAYGVGPEEADRLSGQGFVVEWSPLSQSVMVQLVPEEGTPLEDKRVRQALNYAVDKEELVKSVLGGYAAILRGQLVGTEAFGYNPDLEPYPYDLERAKQMLAEAGYPDGFTIRFQSSMGRYPKQKEVAEALVGQLAAVGVDFDLELLEWSTFINGLVTVSPERAPTWLIGLWYLPSLDADFVIQHYLSDSMLQQFSHPKLDELYQQQAQEFDREKRRKIIQEFMAVVRDEAPNIFLYQNPDIYVTNKRVQGYKATPDNVIHLENVSLKE